jgi:hypothetical protein
MKMYQEQKTWQEIHYKIERFYDPKNRTFGCIIRALDTTQTNWFATEEQRDQFIKEAKAELDKGI